MAKVKRNAPCPCGSGKKYKKCCLEYCDCCGCEMELLGDDEAQVTDAYVTVDEHGNHKPKEVRQYAIHI